MLVLGSAFLIELFIKGGGGGEGEREGGQGEREGVASGIHPCAYTFLSLKVTQ